MKRFLSLMLAVVFMFTAVSVYAPQKAEAGVPYRSVINKYHSNTAQPQKAGSYYVWIDASQNLKCGTTKTNAKTIAKNVTSAITNGTNIYYTKDIYSTTYQRQVTYMYKKLTTQAPSLQEGRQVAFVKRQFRVLTSWAGYFYIIKSNSAWHDKGLYKMKMGSSTPSARIGKSGSSYISFSLNECAGYGNYISAIEFHSDVSNNNVWLYNASRNTKKKLGVGLGSLIMTSKNVSYTRIEDFDSYAMQTFSYEYATGITRRVTG